MTSTFAVEYQDESEQWRPDTGGYPDRTSALQAALALTDLRKTKARITNERTGKLVFLVKPRLPESAPA